MNQVIRDRLSKWYRIWGLVMMECDYCGTIYRLWYSLINMFLVMRGRKTRYLVVEKL
jgi:hypothetical protein